MERATAVDATASVLESFRDTRLFTTFLGGVGVEISVKDFDLKRRRMAKVDGEINSRIFQNWLTSRKIASNVAHGA